MTIESRNWMLLAIVLLIGWLIYLLGPVLTPFAASALLAYLADPLVDRMERWHIRRWKLGRTGAVLMVFVLMSAVLVTLLLIVIPLLQKQVTHLVEKLPDYIDWFTGTVIPWLQQTTGLELNIMDVDAATAMLKDYWKEASTAAGVLVESIGRSGATILGWIANLVLIPVVTFYLLRDWDHLVAGIRKLIPLDIEPTVSRLARESDEVLGAFIRGQLVVMVILGLIYSIGLSLVGIDMAFLIGMSAGLLSFVPYLGSILGVVGALIAAMVQYHDVLHLVLVLVVFGIGQALEGMVLTPWLVGDKIGLHPVAVMFAVLAGGQLFGFLGILLALPVASVLMVLLRHAHGMYKSSRLYERDPIRFEDV